MSDYEQFFTDGETDPARQRDRALLELSEAFSSEESWRLWAVAALRLTPTESDLLTNADLRNSITTLLAEVECALTQARRTNNKYALEGHEQREKLAAAERELELSLHRHKTDVEKLHQKDADLTEKLAAAERDVLRALMTNIHDEIGYTVTMGPGLKHALSLAIAALQEPTPPEPALKWQANDDRQPIVPDKDYKTCHHCCGTGCGKCNESGRLKRERQL